MIPLPSWSELAAGFPPAQRRAGIGLVVDGASQTLHLIPARGAAQSWPVSTAAAGFGCQEGSWQTPVGRHGIHAKIGADAPLGMVFRGREPTGEICLTADDQAGDLITTRILWLEGLEPGLNQGGQVDSRQRYIYIHGTPRADRLGQPASLGCIRMGNEAIVQLFDLVAVGVPVLILPA